MEIKVRTKEQQAIDNLKAIVNSKDKIIEIEPPIEDTAQILLDCITNLQEKLEVSQTNEETYRLEMLDITKCLGLDKDTIFDELKNVLDKKDKEINRLNNIINELEKELYKIRELTFTKYNSNEWNNCLSFNDDILPVINRIKELKGSEK